MKGDSARACRILLEQQQVEFYSPIDSVFGAPIQHMASSLISDIDDLENSSGRDNELLCLMRCFLFAGLLWYRMGRGDVAVDLMRDAMKVIGRTAARTNRPALHIHLLQPAINVARILRYGGGWRRCQALFKAINSFMAGRAAFMLGIAVDAASAVESVQADSEMHQIVRRSHTIETLKGALSAYDLSCVAAVLRERADQSDIAPFLLECYLKMDLLSDKPDSVLQRLAKENHTDMWQFPYAIDAFAALGCRADAVEIGEMLIDKAGTSDDAERAARLLHGAALRLWHIGADDVAQKANAAAAMIGGAISDVARIRTAGLNALVSNDMNSRAANEYAEHLWAIVQASRYGVERAVVLSAVALGRIDGLERFRDAAAQLFFWLRPLPPFLRHVRRVIHRMKCQAANPSAAVCVELREAYLVRDRILSLARA
jgi:hypothetical protein